MQENPLQSEEICDQQQITDEDQTGTNTEQAGEEYRKRGITKIRKDSSQD